MEKNNNGVAITTAFCAKETANNSVDFITLLCKVLVMDHAVMHNAAIVQGDTNVLL